MRKILFQLKSYVQTNFHPALYASIGVFIAGCLFINYRYDVEDGLIDKLPQTQRFLAMFLFHTIPYLVVCLLLLFYRQSTTWFRERGFWIRLVLGFGILAFDRSWSIYGLFSPFFDGVDLSYILRVAGKLKSLVSMVLPLAVLSILIEKDRNLRLYGLKMTYFDPRPYLLLLAIAGIAIVIGGFFKDIQDYYPRYLAVNGQRFADMNEIPGWFNVLLYEFAYGTDFISVEMFFRGFLIIGMVRFLGPQVVLPMIVTYCFLHFGKPLTESISSLFGGYILGIIALNSRSVWGGVMIHVGIAWLMEVVGYLFRVL